MLGNYYATSKIVCKECNSKVMRQVSKSNVELT